MCVCSSYVLQPPSDSFSRPPSGTASPAATRAVFCGHRWRQPWHLRKGGADRLWQLHSPDATSSWKAEAGSSLSVLKSCSSLAHIHGLVLCGLVRSYSKHPSPERFVSSSSLWSVNPRAGQIEGPQSEATIHKIGIAALAALVSWNSVGGV